MSFKENLLRKMAIDRLADQVIASIGLSGSDKKAERSTMRQLVEMGPHKKQKERDLDLYLLDLGTGKKEVLVLDNELAIYETTPEEVGLRKSPTLKEMISIRNAIKILNDKDVKVSTKEASVNRIRNAWIAGLDLSYTLSDIDAIEKDGKASLDRGYMEGVIESLNLFGELLGYVPAQKPLEIPHCHIIGLPVQKPSGEKALGPIVIYAIVGNTLSLLEGPIGIYDKEKIKELQEVGTDKRQGKKSGPDVFTFLKEATVSLNRSSAHPVKQSAQGL